MQYKEYINKDIEREKFEKLCKDWYGGDYHKRHNYGSGQYRNSFVDMNTAKQLIEHFGEVSFLIGGCGDGGVVKQLVDLGVVAKGFDIVDAWSNDGTLSSISNHLAIGNIIDGCPYEENFDVFVTCDVLEHLPQNLIPVVADWVKDESFKHMYHVIGTGDDPENPDSCHGHITYKPLEWWVDIFRDSWKHVPVGNNFRNIRGWQYDNVPGAIIFTRI